ncbi:transposase, OrfB family protein [Streptomyces azureus]|uniref:Transposase, OrfB family protein n=1 Tax=Streptomyces azureus TaxID=146537 RepID=A0A0K8PVT8_STRAJ|nr:transposase, OrfB family protein [Streptomyces azureus]
MGGGITKATHDQWTLSLRAQLARIQGLEAGVRTIAHRLSLPVREEGTKRAPGGYRTRQEWFAKTRRLTCLRTGSPSGVPTARQGGCAWYEAGRLARNRHHLDQAQLTEAAWRQQWEASRWFLQADGESGKRFGSETIRLTPDGEVSIKLPAQLAHLANAGHGRCVLTGTVAFHHRDEEWADRVAVNRAVAYRIHLDTGRGRWYVTASWTIPPVKTAALAQARAGGMIGVDNGCGRWSTRSP